MKRKKKTNFINKIVSITFLSTFFIIFFIYLLLAKFYENKAVNIMEELAKNNGKEYFSPLVENENIKTFYVKVDTSKNIIEIIDNTEFGIERDIYRVIKERKKSGIVSIKNTKMRFLKEDKPYGEIIVFYNRDVEINKINKLVFNFILVEIFILLGFFIAIKVISKKST